MNTQVYFQVAVRMGGVQGLSEPGMWSWRFQVELALWGVEALLDSKNAHQSVSYWLIGSYRSFPFLTVKEEKTASPPSSSW